jgi:ABC-type multidrug transport system fused ATPase/permease subunit
VHPDLSLSLKPGKVVALVGPSGQGKSTIAHLIEGFYLPENGKVLLDGFDTKDLDPKFLRKNIAIVSQEPSLFACTIAENIAYGASDEDFANDEDKKLKIIEAAKLANAHDFIVSFPEGYNTVVRITRGMGIILDLLQRILTILSGIS